MKSVVNNGVTRINEKHTCKSYFIQSASSAQKRGEWRAGSPPTFQNLRKHAIDTPLHSCIHRRLQFTADINNICFPDLANIQGIGLSAKKLSP
ncbi:jg7680 [Pararge aegeria aegeria]|uniref:Jg7680 protein n=1 Tax=Pararge aegeria aegeria TaxID=348720 RepID=A0A8S4S1U1_9NEOP|nr:jg7680 [Pararge aegeria aegeria]